VAKVGTSNPDRTISLKGCSVSLKIIIKNISHIPRPLSVVPVKASVAIMYINPKIFYFCVTLAFGKEKSVPTINLYLSLEVVFTC
jgi:hypothetical protein